MKSEIRQLPAQSERVECGAIQFGDDWPGVFIRGDNAGYYAMMLRGLLDGTFDIKKDAILRVQIESLQRSLAGCVLGPAAEMVKLHTSTSEGEGR